MRLWASTLGLLVMLDQQIGNLDLAVAEAAEANAAAKLTMMMRREWVRHGADVRADKEDC